MILFPYDQAADFRTEDGAGDLETELLQDEAKRPASRLSPWRILIVDDDAEVHAVTRLTLRGFSFEGRRLEILAAHSAAEALAVFADHPDIAVALVDVVMEHDRAGLELAQQLRFAGYDVTRILIRTGQPGAAPPRKVIVDYDINDYLAKTEITADRLFMVLTAALRSYQQLLALDHMRAGLQRIVDASTDLFELASFERFVAGVLQQVSTLVQPRSAGNGGRASVLLSARQDGALKTVAGTGRYQNVSTDYLAGANGGMLLETLALAVERNESLFGRDYAVLPVPSQRADRHVLYIEHETELNEIERRLLTLFARNLGVAFDNVMLHAAIARTETELVETIGAIAETRSPETGRHVCRVAEYSAILASHHGCTPHEINLLRLAAPLHDIGKVGIPDAILRKPARHTPEETEIMRTHAQLGHDMLAGAGSPVLRHGALIALTHHEWWDGSGYPYGLRGDEIPVAGRIVAIADVLDALLTRRSYKPPWPADEVRLYMAKRSGTQFDPALVAHLLGNFDQFTEVCARLAD